MVTGCGHAGAEDSETSTASMTASTTTSMSLWPNRRGIVENPYPLGRRRRDGYVTLAKKHCIVCTARLLSSDWCDR
jgi:hypothetical protein